MAEKHYAANRNAACVALCRWYRACKYRAVGALGPAIVSGVVENRQLRSGWLPDMFSRPVRRFRDVERVNFGFRCFRARCLPAHWAI